MTLKKIDAATRGGVSYRRVGADPIDTCLPLPEYDVYRGDDGSDESSLSNDDTIRLDPIG